MNRSVVRDPLQGIHPSLASECRSRTEIIRTAARRGLTEMREIGTHLLWIRENLGHGRFGRYLTQYAGLPSSTAKRAMDIARSWNQISHVGNLPQRLLYQIAEIPNEDQPAIIELVKGHDYDVKEVVQKCKEAKKRAKGQPVRSKTAPQPSGAPESAVPSDHQGRPVPARLRSVFTARNRLDELADAVSQLKFKMDEYVEKYASCAALGVEGIGGLGEALELVRQTVLDARPATWCPHCDGNKSKQSKCSTCSKRGWLSQYEVDDAAQGTLERIAARGTEQEVMF